MLVDFVHVTFEQQRLSRDLLHVLDVFEDYVDAVSGVDMLFLSDSDGLE